MADTTIIATSVAILAWSISEGQAQEQPEPDPAPASCYGPGSIATAVLLTFFCTLSLIGVLFYFWKKRSDAKKGTHLILETDPERGAKAEYAFDNPGFKDATLIASSEKFTKPESSTNKTKWGHWSPLAALNLKPEKKRPLDDSALQNHEVKVVALKSQDFTGLGFNICGNMKEGIYIRDILHRGPAFESGKLNPGDRINSVTISFEHMVYEDALTILSYASPYEVIVEAKSGRTISVSQGQGQTPVHPIYRSSSAVDLTYTYPEKSSKKKLFGDDHSSSSNYSSLQKSRSNVTTLERKESKSPRPNQPKSRKPERSPQKISPEMLKTHLEQTITEEQRGQKFGVRVLPLENQQSPKIFEQNQNNVNIERNMEEIPIRSIDEVDVLKLPAPQARKREKKSPEPAFERNGSGIKRDLNGIPLEIPEHMQDAALMAKRNRKSLASDERIIKGKAPSPPPPGEVKINFTLGGAKARAFEDLSTLGNGSDSEDERNTTMSSVNTIELNSSDITIHQIQEEERKSRKTASTGDLTKMKKAPRSNSGTLERAQSLDITDTSTGGLTKNRTHDATENLLIDREPRLSLILDGLNTFQRNRLKSSTEWGNLEDAILSFTDEDFEQRRKSEPQFNAVMDRVIQIKRESQEIEVIPDEVVKSYQQQTSVVAPKIKNKLWPDEEDFNKFEDSGWKRLGTQQEIVTNEFNRRQQVPVVPERTKLKLSEVALPQPTERVSKIDLILDAKPSPSSLLNQPNSNISVEYECITPVPPKRERTPDKETVINLNNKISKVSPVTSFEKNNISELCSQIAKGRNCEGPMIKDEWEVDTLNNTSPPPSMTLVDEVMDSFNKNYGNAVVVVRTDDTPNLPDETKNVGNLKNVTANFIFNERSVVLESDTNVPDDVKVSRGSYESLEAAKLPPKSDDAKTEDLLVTHVTVTENGGGSNLHSLELSINNEPSELYTTALETSSADISSDVTVIVSKPPLSKITVKSEPLVEVLENSFSKLASNNVQITFEDDSTKAKDDTTSTNKDDHFKSIEDESPAISLTEIKADDDDTSQTYVTEIQVLTPSTLSNVSEVKVTTPETNNDDQLENAFENYVKSFEQKLETFESNMQNFENNLEGFIRDEPKSIVLEEKSDIEKQVSKIQEIAEEQLKTLPEMRFSTSSYESGGGGRKTPEKRHSFELLRSNFEKASNDNKSPPRRDSTTPPKSRIPISTTMKTPPMSPERRDSRNLENENDKAILELMSASSIHSTPLFTSKIKPPSASTKNVSVTSIRQNSKIPSGLPTLSSRPPIPPRKSEENLLVSTNGSVESIKQWVFNPNSNVTNVTVVGKEKVLRSYNDHIDVPPSYVAQYEPNSNISVEYECITPVPPKRERTPDKETVINLNNKISKVSPVTSFEKNNISELCSQIAKGRNCEGPMIKDEWEVDTLNNTSPPPSMTLVDEVMDSFNKNYGNAVVVVQTDDTPNLPDETKNVGTLKNVTANFIFNERSVVLESDTNVPDDVKVSRGSYESLEAAKLPPKSDDAKTEDLLVTHVTVTENGGGSNLHSLELSINNEPSELYTTALETSSADISSDVTVIVSKPPLSKITVKSEPLVEVLENSFSKLASNNVQITFEDDSTKAKNDTTSTNKDDHFKSIEDESPAISLTEIKADDDDTSQTYVTEIQVLTPNTLSNVSEVKVTTSETNNDDQLENAFENYVKSFEQKLETFESNMQNFENNLEEFIRDEPKSIVLEEKSDIEKQVSKIQEIAEEQLKTLPEMRFSTSSYESGGGGRKTPEKRHSFELLRSNFEKASNDNKSPPRRDSTTPPKSRIPISTTMKTPPMSPERRDSRNLENENDKAILELMSASSIHSTPFTSKIKPPSASTKNVSVTSIRQNSKIPSGLPTLSSRPPIPPRKSEENLLVSTNGSVESIKQWVFNPNSNVTNVTVVGKEK